MSSIKIMNKGEKYAHATIGCIKGFEGKQFVKEATEATSCEVSFGTLPTGASVPFFIAIRQMKKTTSFYQGLENFR